MSWINPPTILLLIVMFCIFKRKMAEIKKETKYLYHYTKTCNLYPILLSMKLKMNKLEETNDPREKLNSFHGIFRTDYFNSEHGCIKLLEEFMNNNPTITCFSGDSEAKKGFNLPTMWAHYADNHKGVCLKINTKKFCQEKENLNGTFRWIDYFQKENFNQFMISNETTKDEILRKLVFSKRDDWSSENEWRLFSLDGIDFCSIENSLESIIIGLDFDHSFLPSIETITKENMIGIEEILIDEQTQDFYIKQSTNQ